jgi:DNA-binding transcriptional ArsR family regulator
MRALSALLSASDAAASGDRARFDASISEGLAKTRGARTFHDEVAWLSVGVDPDADPFTSPEPLAAWCVGASVELPFGLLGIALHPRHEADDVLGYVVTRPGRPPRRIFGAGVGFAEGLTQSSRPGRTETAVSVVALAGRAGLDKADFFQRVYGFPYRKELHQGPLEVLVHRVRKTVGDSLELERGEDRIAVAVRAPLSVPDPRCIKPLDERLLRALAEHGGGSAKDVAKALGVSIRTVQGVIKHLTEDGSCIADRQGRNVIYRIEDTTFSEPTRQHTRRQIL